MGNEDPFEKYLPKDTNKILTGDALPVAPMGGKIIFVYESLSVSPAGLYIPDESEFHFRVCRIVKAGPGRERDGKGNLPMPYQIDNRVLLQVTTLQHFFFNEVMYFMCNDCDVAAVVDKEKVEAVMKRK